MQLPSFPTFRFLLILIILFSCQDIVEPGIKDLTVNLTSPADNYTSTSSSLLFMWDGIKGAEKYHLQIASPDFTNIQLLVADTNVAGTKFNWTLQPGSYQWRVQAVNGGGSTVYSTRTLSVDSNSNISSQPITLNAPADNYFTMQATNVFKWARLNNADDYRFQIINQSAGATVVDVVLETDSFQYTLAEGSFTWQVRGQNALSNTAYSSRAITIDQTAPVASTPSSPINGSTVSNPVILSWLSDAEAIADSLVINTDSTFNATAFYKGYHTVTSYTVSGTIGQKYFWRLRSADAAGNWSSYGSSFNFRVQ